MPRLTMHRQTLFVQSSAIHTSNCYSSPHHKQVQARCAVVSTGQNAASTDLNNNTLTSNKPCATSQGLAYTAHLKYMELMVPGWPEVLLMQPACPKHSQRKAQPVLTSVVPAGCSRGHAGSWRWLLHPDWSLGNCWLHHKGGLVMLAVPLQHTANTNRKEWY